MLTLSKESHPLLSHLVWVESIADFIVWNGLEELLQLSALEFGVDLDVVLEHPVVYLRCISRCLWNVLLKVWNLVEVTENAEVSLEFNVKDVDMSVLFFLTDLRVGLLRAGEICLIVNQFFVDCDLRGIDLVVIVLRRKCSHVNAKP